MEEKPKTSSVKISTLFPYIATSRQEMHQRRSCRAALLTSYATSGISQLLSTPVPTNRYSPPSTDHSKGDHKASHYRESASRQAVFIFRRDAVSNAPPKATPTFVPPLRTIPRGGGASIPPCLCWPRRLIPGKMERHPRRAIHRRRPRHLPHTQPVPSSTLPRPRRIIPGTMRDPQASLPRCSTPLTDHSGDSARPPRVRTKQPPPTSHSQEPSLPPKNSPGDDKIPRGTNNGDHPIGRPHLSPGA